MADTISGADQRTVGVSSNKAVQETKQQKSNPSEVVTTSATTIQGSSVELSPELQGEIAAVSFDNKKVDQIKQAIEQGNYPLDDKKIAESFIPLEKLL